MRTVIEDRIAAAGWDENVNPEKEKILEFDLELIS